MRRLLGLAMVAAGCVLLAPAFWLLYGLLNGAAVGLARSAVPLWTAMAIGGAVLIVASVWFFFRRRLRVGDRIRLSGGYDMYPVWNPTGGTIFASVVDFIPGQGLSPALVAKLDQVLTVKNISGQIIVLELRYTGDGWSEEGEVHIELCDFVPLRQAWSKRPQGQWVESHASYRKV